jgi:hypothetical protein
MRALDILHPLNILKAYGKTVRAKTVNLLIMQFLHFSSILLLHRLRTKYWYPDFVSKHKNKGVLNPFTAKISVLKEGNRRPWEAGTHQTTRCHNEKHECSCFVSDNSFFSQHVYIVKIMSHLLNFKLAGPELFGNLF